jgi:hypothetical protein
MGYHSMRPQVARSRTTQLEASDYGAIPALVPSVSTSGSGRTARILAGRRRTSLASCFDQESLSVTMLDRRAHKITTHSETLAALHSTDPAAVRYALVGITLHEPDWRWAQSECARLASHPLVEVRALAATCMQHLARIHSTAHDDSGAPSVASPQRAIDRAPLRIRRMATG